MALHHSYGILISALAPMANRPELCNRFAVLRIARHFFQGSFFCFVAAMRQPDPPIHYRPYFPIHRIVVAFWLAALVIGSG